MGDVLLRPRAVRGARLDRDDAEVFVFDAVLSEDHEENAEVSTHPLETGAEVTDHVRVSPISFSISGIVSNTPLDGEPGADRDFAAWDRLRGLKNARRPLRVVTPLRVYDDMVITSISTKRDPDGGQALAASIWLKQIVTADRRTITLPERVVPRRRPRAVQTTDAGRQTADPPTPEDKKIAEAAPKNESWLRGAFGSLWG